MKTDRLGAILSPATRFWWGMGLVLILSLCSWWPLKLGITFLGYLLALSAGKKINLIYFMILSLTVAFFHLLVPFGKVLFQIFDFPITEGALVDGLMKGVSLSGLVFISLFSVSRDLKIPGRLGRLWEQTFVYYEKLLSLKNTLKRKGFFSLLDKTLEELYPTQEGTSAVSDNIVTTLRVSSKTSKLGWGLVCLSLVIVTGLEFLQFLLKASFSF